MRHNPSGLFRPAIMPDKEGPHDDTHLSRPERRPASAPARPPIEPFLRHLCAAGYAERTLRKKRSIAASFARWTQRAQVAAGDLNESHVTAFVERSPRRRKSRVRFELAALRPFLGFLRGEAGVPIPPLR